jgi:RHS repeat-associated protein
MKTTGSLAIMTALVISPALHGQSCYTSISSLVGGYSLNGSANGACKSSTCSVSESASADVNAFRTQLVTCDEVGWFGTDSVTSLSLNDTEVTPCPVPPGGVITDTFVGTSGTSSSSLVANLANGTYTYTAAPDANWTLTIENPECNGGTQTKTGTDFPMGPLTNYPPTFALPTSVSPLNVGPYSFSGMATEPIVAEWEFTFTLTPNYDDDDDCKNKGGQGTGVPPGTPPGVPVQGPLAVSSIGCANQSLGESVSVVGTGFNLYYESDRALGAPGDSAASADAAMIGGWTLSVHHAYDPNTNTLFLGNGQQRNGYQLGTPVSFNGDLLLTSEDGSEVYVFSSTGQHLQTLRPLTGALEYQFGYDSAGNLVTVTDASGNVSTIQRNASEQPTAIVSPYAQTTTLGVDSNGFLSQVTDPLGNSETFVNSSGGLLMSRTDQNGNIFDYTYDGNGRLIDDADPLGGYTTANRTDATSGFGWTVGQTTAMGITSSYQSTLTMPWAQSSTSTFNEQRTITWPNGLQATSSNSLESGRLDKSFTLPDGTSDSETLSPDLVWGLQAPVDTSETLTLGSLATNVTGSRKTVLGTAGNPFTETSETDTETVNGRAYTSTFTASNHTWVSKTPVGRTLTVALDSLERIASTQIDGLTATDVAYDSHGRLASLTKGTRITSFGYNSSGFLASVTDPLQLTTGYAYDADGHLSATTLPDGRVINYTYDANGNLTSVTPPGKSAHQFTYNAVNLPTSYTPPTVSGAGVTTYDYNLDRDMTTITRPDGETIQFGYDSAGRLSSTTTPTETISYSYDPKTGNLSSASITGGEALAYGYNGPLPISSALTGTVAGSVSRVYNDNFWIASESINGGNTVNFTYDNDGLITNAGSLALKLSSKDGLITETTLGGATDSRKYDDFGELTGDTDKYKSTSVYAVTFTRDADGRVSGKTETYGKQKNTYAYTYDPSARLAAVTKNGVAFSSYTYDTNSNRLTETNSSGTVAGTYDAQDRLLTYGNASYTYTANGELASQTAGSQTTTYNYDVLGNLIGATLPNGNQISYFIDPENHRVGKEVNGVLETGFLYDGDKIVAQLNGSNQIVSQFVYGTGSTSPDYMVEGGVTYRIFSDQLGAPVAVVNTSTGAVAEQITYDEFGNVLSDSNPGFQPFGFAGGLYDQDTKLVRFGSRDYNPAIGRWTAKDPISFNGGDTNLYGYVLNDPVNMIDVTGLVNSYLQAFIDMSRQAGYTDAQIAREWLRSCGIRWVQGINETAKVSQGFIKGGISILGYMLDGVIIRTQELNDLLYYGGNKYDRRICRANPMRCKT